MIFSFRKNSIVRAVLMVASMFFLYVQKPIETQATGIPVVDVAGLHQSILQVIENTSQTLKMIEQYETQLQQYQVQLKNSMNLSSFIWTDAKQEIDSLIQSIDTLKHYKNQAGNIEDYLDKFQDFGFYKSHSCFQADGCNESERNKITENRQKASEARKRTNDALMRSIDYQQKRIANDAYQLQQIQTNAESAAGQLEAIQYATQIAGNQAHQLMQIRSLLVAQQNASAALMQSDLDKDAQEKAAGIVFRKSAYKQSSGQSW